MTKFITLHIVNDIPYSNLNRDDTGTPKRTLAGGVERGLLSSQSLKRAARKDYENRIINLTPGDLEDSYRSRSLHELVMLRVEELLLEVDSDIEYDKKKLARVAKGSIDNLTKQIAKGSKVDLAVSVKDVITWLSLEEIEILAKELISPEFINKYADATHIEPSEFLKSGATGSLAIAAFGRMFANQSHYQTEAALAVSPAISTHGSIIEADYFITADDYLVYDEENTGGAGAAHLGTALYTSGVFYRSVTIDVDELWSNWSGKSSAEFREVFLTQFITSLIRSLPTGKKNSTAPYTEPLLVLAEEQSYRAAYSVTEPVRNPGEDGYRSGTIKMLSKQYELARLISGENYGRTAVSGVMGEPFIHTVNDGLELSTIAELSQTIISWMEEKLVTEDSSAEDTSATNGW